MTRRGVAPLCAHGTPFGRPGNCAQCTDDEARRVKRDAFAAAALTGLLATGATSVAGSVRIAFDAGDAALLESESRPLPEPPVRDAKP
jgi:hypothetical protein